MTSCAVDFASISEVDKLSMKIVRSGNADA